MLMRLGKIYQPSNKSYNITARNHKDQTVKFSCPNHVDYIDYRRWLDAGENCTELTVTNDYGRTATIQLEGYDWCLIVSGNIEDGRKIIKVEEGRDFDVMFTSDGHMQLQIRNGENWGDGLGNSLDFVLVPFQERRISSTLFSLVPSCPSDVPSCSVCFFLLFLLWRG